jgi:rhodanese-related sulfurtransferase
MRGGSFWRVSWVAVLALGCEAGDSGGAGEVADVADVAVVLPDSEAVQADLGPILPDLGVVLPDVAGDAAVDVDAVFVPPDALTTPPDAAPRPPDAGPPTLGTVTPADLFAALPADDLLLIDVHVPYAGELPNTDTHIVYTDTAALLAFIGPDRDTPVVLYCLTDHMSLIAGNALVAEGYRAIRSLAGGMRAWEAAGYPLEHRP